MENKSYEVTAVCGSPDIMGMTLDEYQALALETAVYPSPIIYPALGICGEAGEIAEKVKKVMRDENGVFTLANKHEIAKEVGDVLWGIANIAHDLGYSLEEIARMNYNKLKSRQCRGKISGSGDNR